MTLVEGGDLFGYMHKRQKIDESEAKIIIKYILIALNYLHK